MTALRLCALALGVAIIGSPALAAPALCERWSAPERVGGLDVAVLPEASGLAISRQWPGRLYHHNNSGGGPKFFVTDADGRNAKAITVANLEGRDIEDMAIGACAEGPACLYIGDVGDNGLRRETVEFAVLAEKEAYGETETPLRVVKARYPDAAHNAEGFALHPNGDLYLITKDSSHPAQLFRLTRRQMETANGEVQTFAPAGLVDIAPMLGPTPAPRLLLITAFDISPDGSTALAMTYGGAIEMNIDLAKPFPPSADWQAGRDYRVIPTAPLPQAEAIAYAADGKSFLYESETPSGQDSPIWRQRCETGR